MQTAIQAFEINWSFARGLTYEFISAVPDEKWDFSPHPHFAPLHKQIRHMVCVQGVYVEGLRKRVTDFGRKHSHYDGSLGRGELVAALRQQDADLHAALDEIARAGEEDCIIEFYGKNTIANYLNVIATHEAIHHGQWSFYATLGGFETPDSWKLNWGL